jgi:asparagine synthase (glutamine-hydrolysing)
MSVVLAWFADRLLSAEEHDRLARRREQVLAPLIPDSYERHATGGDDWGVLALHPPHGEVWQWSVMAQDASLTAVTFGLPVGIDLSGGPLRLARRVLGGEDVHASVLPPFGLLAIEGSSRAVIQQDWLGMCRIFTAEAQGITAFATRPSLVAQFLGLPLQADVDGWLSYTLCGHFGGMRSPIQGVRLLDPGRRVSVQRREGGGWASTLEQRRNLDDVIAHGIALRDAGVNAALDLAARAVADVVRTAADLAVGDITVGLSGGKDSRVIAAALIAADRIPRFQTHDDLTAEGETATRLLAMLHERRGIETQHRVNKVGNSAVVQSVGLRERIERLQRIYDYQFPSTYSVRALRSERLGATQGPMSFTGAGGELATGYWYPPINGDTDDTDDVSGRRAAAQHLLAAVDQSVAANDVLQAEHERIDAILDNGVDLGLRGVELCDYLYLVERVRRWYTSAYATGMIVPFLAPDYVAATFALSAEDKRARFFHHGLIGRLVPEWADVPYVTSSAGRSTATSIWEGDGLRVLCDMLDTHGGKLPGLLRHGRVEAALFAAATGVGSARDQRTLEQYAALAVASETLERDSVHAPKARTYDRVRRGASSLRMVPARQQAQPISARLSAVAAHLRFIRRTRLGNRLWVTARSQVIQRRLTTPVSPITRRRGRR